MRIYSILADLVLIFHTGVVAFNLLSLPVIIVGRLFRREFIHNPWFRYSHLASMAVVVLLAVFNKICPLTDWEGKLRSLETTGVAYRKTVIQQWVGEFIYYDFAWGTVALAYCIWFIAILVTLWLIPVRRQRTPW
ncbi:DUF2784 domain-containing protein [Desulfopila sp. IMCC35008]|uniref:DUF2784 domain-containing protein n=1 Tax=Desulfopila sp. IMCC35008 TaxID=2653858 RepID=UPI0013D0ADD6|nr:DUF2784 domain-containing protein [Desulfopila sp. IMCC35008]